MGVTRKRTDGVEAKILDLKGIDNNDDERLGHEPMKPTGPLTQDIPPIGPRGNPERARERAVGQDPTSPIAPGGVPREGLPGESAEPFAFGGAPGVQRAGSAPSMPTDPTPVSTQAPQPFTPMAPPTGVTRRAVGAPSAPSSRLFGRAGGLMGGGMGVPGIYGGGGNDISALILQLLKGQGR